MYTPLEFEKNDFSTIGNLYVTSHIYKMIESAASEILNCKAIGFVASAYVETILKEKAKNNLLRYYGIVSDFCSGYVVDIKNNESNIGKRSNALYLDEKNKVVISFFSPDIYPYYNIPTVHLFAESEEKCSNYINNILKEMQFEYKTKIMHIIDKSIGREVKFVQKDKNVNYDDVLLSEDLKHDIIRSVSLFFTDDVYKKYNIKHKRGILLYGKPGNGKTTLLKAITNSVDVPVIYWQVNERTDTDSIEDVFLKCKNTSPSLLIIEDIDSIPDHLRSVFLNYMDGGIYNNEGVLVIGTTNYPERIDPALMNRAGRFDRAYEIKPPSENLICSYLIKLGIKSILNEEEIKYISKKMVGFSMSILNELYTSIVLDKYYEDTLDIDKIIRSLKNISEKQSNDKWFESEDKKVGF